MARGIALLDLRGAEESAAALAKEFKADVIPFTVDVTDTPALEAAFDSTAAHFGELTLVANNAVRAAPAHQATTTHAPPLLLHFPGYRHARVCQG